MIKTAYAQLCYYIWNERRFYVHRIKFNLIDNFNHEIIKFDISELFEDNFGMNFDIIEWLFSPSNSKIG